MRCSDFLSQRANRFLAEAGAEQDGDFASETELASLLGREQLTVWPELVAFEQRLGGLRFELDGNGVRFGVLSMSRTEPRLRPAPDDDRVLIGTDGDVDYYMDRGGQVLTCGPDHVLWPCASSGEKLLEHLAMVPVFAAFDEDPFHVVLGPRAREVSSVLGLALDEVASDTHEAYWFSGEHALYQRLQGDWYNTSTSALYCRSFESAFETIQRLCAALPDLEVAVQGAAGQKKEEYVPRAEAVVPTLREVEAWAGTSGALRFEGKEVFGKKTVLWLLPGAGEPARMEQYEVLVSGAQVEEWSSFSAAEQRARIYTG